MDGRNKQYNLHDLENDSGNRKLINLYEFIEPTKTTVYEHQTCKGRNINNFSSTGQYICIKSHHDNSLVLFLKDMKRQVMSDHSCAGNFMGILYRTFYTHPSVRTASLSQSSGGNTRLCFPVLSPGSFYFHVD